jgi:transcription initiation factor TFIIB
MELTRTYRYVLRELHLEVAPADPESYVPRFVSDLELADEVECRARELIESARSEDTLGGGHRLDWPPQRSCEPGTD